MTDRRAPALVLLVATAAVSVSAVLTLEAQTDAATVVWLRMALAVALLSPWAIPQLRRRPPDARDLGLTLAAGTLLAVHFLSWTVSLGETSVAASVLLVSLHPLIVTPVAARLLGDRLDLRLLGGVALAIAGTVVTFVGGLGRGQTLHGDLLALLGAVALAGYLLIGRGRRARGGVAGYSAVVYAVVAAFGAGAAGIGGHLSVPGWRALAACLGLAAASTVGGHTLFNWALQRLPAASVSLAFLGEPPLAALLAYAVLGQGLAVTTLVGGGLILGGLAFAARSAVADAASPPAAAPAVTPGLQ